MGQCCSTPEVPINPVQVDLSHFTLLKVVGKGGFGKVNAIQRRSTSELMALKRMGKAEVAKKESHIRMVWTERSIMARLNSPFLVNLVHAFQDDKELYFVEPFMQGGDLRYHLSKLGCFSESDSKFYAAEILLGLEAMHSLKIVYRDLKPDNVLLDSSGHLRISDFGLSVELKEKNKFSVRGNAGTSGYLAPEVCTGELYGLSCDIWTYGITIYELIHGRRPFKQWKPTDSGDFSSQIRFGSNVSQSCQDLIRQLLCINPQKRIGCGKNGWAEIRAHAWFSDIDWDAMKRRSLAPPIIPDLEQANCSNSADLADQLMDREPEPVSAEEQKHFVGFEFRTDYKQFLEEVERDSRLAGLNMSQIHETEGLGGPMSTATSHMLNVSHMNTVEEPQAGRPVEKSPVQQNVTTTNGTQKAAAGSSSRVPPATTVAPASDDLIQVARTPNNVVAMDDSRSSTPVSPPVQTPLLAQQHHSTSPPLVINTSSSTLTAASPHADASTLPTASASLTPQPQRKHTATTTGGGSTNSRSRERSGSRGEEFTTIPEVETPIITGVREDGTLQTHARVQSRSVGGNEHSPKQQQQREPGPVNLVAHLPLPSNQSTASKYATTSSQGADQELLDITIAATPIRGSVFEPKLAGSSNETTGEAKTTTAATTTSALNEQLPELLGNMAQQKRSSNSVSATGRNSVSSTNAAAPLVTTAGAATSSVTGTPLQQQRRRKSAASDDTIPVTLSPRTISRSVPDVSSVLTLPPIASAQPVTNDSHTTITATTLTPHESPLFQPRDASATAAPSSPALRSSSTSSSPPPQSNSRRSTANRRASAEQKNEIPFTRNNIVTPGRVATPVMAAASS